jgi:hypothetical protein
MSNTSLQDQHDAALLEAAHWPEFKDRRNRVLLCLLYHCLENQHDYCWGFTRGFWERIGILVCIDTGVHLKDPDVIMKGLVTDRKVSFSLLGRLVLC